MKDHIILGVHITNRMKNAVRVQEILTEYGCHIRTRLGLHEVDENFCAQGGVLILEMVGEDKTIDEMAAKLKAVEGLELQKLVFRHN
ncbi:MAG TPA: hypothetical protein PKH07_02545 [bacterium]|nr:hypothetical protein [bacterium]